MGRSLSGQTIWRTFQPLQKRLSDLVSKEMLAIRLSALAGNLPIKVRTDPDEPGTPEIRIMYLQNK